MATAVRSLREAVDGAASRLAKAGCETPRLDSEILVADALGIRRERVQLDAARELSRGDEAAIARLVERRARREPVAYIVGRRAFRRLDLAVDRRVLIPRPESEVLVELALEVPAGAHAHDVGTGSGAIALAIKDERPDLLVTASDASPDAIEVAHGNAHRLSIDVGIEHARDLPAVAASADLVVANLPYVREEEWPGLMPEITRHEPRDALVAGRNGLEVIQAFVASVPPGTRLALEHAPPQAAAVRGLLDGARTLRDLAGRERATVGHAP